jgi:Na+/melibiose symporter-like transporter
MKIQYRITEDDYASAARLHAWRHFIARPSATATTQLAAFAIIIVLPGLCIWMFPGAAPLFAFVVAVVVIVCAFNLFVITPSRARRHYRQYRAIQEPIAAELTDEGIKFSTADGEAILPWAKVFQWRQNDRFILIYGMPILFYILPKSIGREGFDIPRLIERLTEHVGPER